MNRGHALHGEATGHLKAVVAKVQDEDLVQSIARGDKGAMRVLYARHSIRIYRFIVRLTGNASLSEDLLSEVFLYVWRQADAFTVAQPVAM